MRPASVGLNQQCAGIFQWTDADERIAYIGDTARVHHYIRVRAMASTYWDYTSAFFLGLRLCVRYHIVRKYRRDSLKGKEAVEWELETKSHGFTVLGDA